MIVREFLLKWESVWSLVLAACFLRCFSGDMLFDGGGEVIVFFWGFVVGIGCFFGF